MKYIGWAVTVVASLATIAMGIGLALDRLNRVLNGAKYASEDIGRTKAARNMRAFAWRFSEDPVTMRLLQDLSLEIEGQKDINDVRRVWRADRAKCAEHAQEQEGN